MILFILGILTPPPIPYILTSPQLTLLDFLNDANKFFKLLNSFEQES